MTQQNPNGHHTALPHLPTYQNNNNQGIYIVDNSMEERQGFWDLYQSIIISSLPLL